MPMPVPLKLSSPWAAFSSTDWGRAEGPGPKLITRSVAISVLWTIDSKSFLFFPSIIKLNTLDLCWSWSQNYNVNRRVSHDVILLI